VRDGTRLNVKQTDLAAWVCLRYSQLFRGAAEIS